MGGRRGRRRLALGRGAAALQAQRGSLPRRERVPRRRAARGASRRSGCAGKSSRRSRARARKPAFRPPPTSTRATTSASATSRSTSGAACAGTRRRRACGRSRAVRISRCRRTRRCAGSSSRTAAAPAWSTCAGDGPRVARAAAEVLLAAGAINSPQLLELSGIGRPDVLQACGIPVVQPLPGVGENLQDHLQLRMVAKVRNVRTLNTLSRGDARQAADRRRVRAAPRRADEHGAVAAGRVRALRPGPGARERRVPRAAAVAPQVRRSAARLRRDHARACATCGRRRAAACTSRRPIPRWRR